METTMVVIWGIYWGYIGMFRVLLVVAVAFLDSLRYSATSMSTAVGEKIPAVELKQGRLDG